MQNIQVNNNLYTKQDYFSVNLSDSFVAPNNKIGSGNGEARLYISSQNSVPLFTFSSTRTISNRRNIYPACDSNCYLVKENLIDYLESTYNYYLNPVQNHNRDILQFYNNRLNEIYSLPDLLAFNIYMQNGNQDSSRFYIGCADDAWNIMRELAIPTYSQLHISKFSNVSNLDDIIYIFELTFNPQSSASRHEQTICTNIQNNTTIDTTERTSLIKARNGQGKFRSNVLRIMPCCPFTGISDPFLLRASHIIPWAQCQTDYQRLDGFNGLSLTPSYDVLFDRGLISFQNNGALLVSPRLNIDICNALRLIPGQIYNIQNINGQRNQYLEFHRNYVFKQ